jgi:hypothetical protein
MYAYINTHIHTYTQATAHFMDMRDQYGSGWPFAQRLVTSMSITVVGSYLCLLFTVTWYRRIRMDYYTKLRGFATGTAAERDTFLNRISQDACNMLFGACPPELVRDGMMNEELRDAALETAFVDWYKEQSAVSLQKKWGVAMAGGYVIMLRRLYKAYVEYPRLLSMVCSVCACEVHV